MARPQPVDLQPCPVQEELETIATLVGNDARVRQIELMLQPAPVPVIIRADGEKLRQAFLNIVINALQATPSGGSLTIATTVDPTGGCMIRFSDTGPGIAADTLAKIFQPFFTTKPDGTGLGLAISKKIIESHGGTLTVESDLGQGTSVIVRLPVQNGAEA